MNKDFPLPKEEWKGHLEGTMTGFLPVLAAVECGASNLCFFPSCPKLLAVLKF